MTALLDWCLKHWWIFLYAWVFGVLSAIGAGFEWLARAYKRMVRNRRRHQLAVKKLELRIAQTEAQREEKTLVRPPKPGPCPHRPKNVKPVYAGDDPVAYLCTACDTQLPLTWAVRAEDL